MVRRNYTKWRNMLATVVWCSFSSELRCENSCRGVTGWPQVIRASARPLWCTCQVHKVAWLHNFQWKCVPVRLSARPFTDRDRTGTIHYSCVQELKFPVRSRFMKGITRIQPRIVRARFMIEISWKESSIFWKWFRHYIFPLWWEVTAPFLVISFSSWHRGLT